MTNIKQNTQGGSSEQHDKQCQKVDVAKKQKSSKRRTSAKDISLLCKEPKDTSVTKRKMVKQGGRNDSPKGVKIDTETVISSSVYKSWLMDSSDRVTKYKQVSEIEETRTLKKLMELPPIALYTGVKWFSQVHKGWANSRHRPSDSGTRMSMDQEDLSNNAGVSTRVAPSVRSESLQIQATEAPHSAGSSEGGPDCEDTNLLGSA